LQADARTQNSCITEMTQKGVVNDTTASCYDFTFWIPPHHGNLSIVTRYPLFLVNIWMAPALTVSTEYTAFKLV